MTYSHCDSLSGSRDECRSAPGQTAADLCTKSTDLSHKSASSQLGNYIYHRHLLLSRYSFYYRTEGRRLSRPRFTCPRAVTRTSSNRFQYRSTTMIEANMLSQHPLAYVAKTVIYVQAISSVQLHVYRPA